MTGGTPVTVRCTPDCKSPTPAQAHCAAAGCHRTFGGVTGFDKHRDNGACIDPATLGMTEIAGVWRVPMTEEARARLSASRGRDELASGSLW